MVNFGGAWSLVKFKSDKHDRVIYSEDGSLNVITIKSCDERQVRCNRINDKAHECLAKKIDDIKVILVDRDKEERTLREKQIGFYVELKTHMSRVDDFMAQIEREKYGD